MALTEKNDFSETGVNYCYQNGSISRLVTESDMLKPHLNGHVKNGLNGHVKVSKNNHYKISALNHYFLSTLVILFLKYHLHMCWCNVTNNFHAHFV